jgi:TolA-binding protein
LATLSKFVRVDASPKRLAKIWSRVSTRIEGQPRPYRSWQKATAALALVATLSVGVGLIARRTAPASAWNGAALETSSDGLRVELDDGSQLALDARTRIGMLGDRPSATAIRIERGKVTCDLVPRPKRPFSVLASDIEVRVTGTRFSVELDPATHHVEVVVERGSVIVVDNRGTDPNRPLIAGERWSATRQPSDSGARRESEPPRAATSASVSIEPSAVPAASSAAPTIPTPREPHAREASTASTGNELPTAKALFEQGNSARRVGDLSGAAQAYQHLLSRFPNDSHVGLAAFELGRLRLGPLRDPVGAVSALKLAIASAPSSALREDAMARLVQAYATSGQIAPCRTARAAYQRDYPSGVHATVVGKSCGGDEGP